MTLVKYGDGDAIFDAEYNSRIFQITSSSFNINGLTFINGNENYGGAIYFANPISNSNINATFTNNIANWGGALYFFETVSDSNITGTFTGNRVNVGGGAIYFDDVENSTITGTYTNNTAPTGGVHFIFRAPSGIFIGGTYINNTAQSGIIHFFTLAVGNSNISRTYINNMADDSLVCLFGHSEILSNAAYIRNAIFLNNRYDESKGVISAIDGGTVAINNWFGSNRTDYQEKPDAAANIDMASWLYLNGSVAQGKAKFFLSSYNASSNETSEYDNTLITGKVNMTLASCYYATINKTHAVLNEEIPYDQSDGRCPVIKATFENAVAMIGDIKGSFDYLQELINGSAENSVIYLNHDYIYNDIDTITTGVLINKSISINGNGYAIDALGNSRIFNVTAGSVNITNVVLRNGKANQGGAIYFANATAYSNINATFINNTANQGGANYFAATLSHVNVSGIYMRNHASDGGANHMHAPVLDSCISGTYINNSAGNGGANYFYKVTGIQDCFVRSILNGTFINNNAVYSGGANGFFMENGLESGYYIRDSTALSKT